MTNRILLLGQPHTSKTVFLTQLYSRLQQRRSLVSLYKPVDDISAITEARSALSGGKEPDATPSSQSKDIEMQLKYKDEVFTLNCPDYGGEQINRIINTRVIEKGWLTKIKSSNNWILFIRPGALNKSMDLSSVTITEDFPSKNIGATGDTFEVSSQTALLELLQMFLNVKEIDYHKKHSQIKISVVLTCWDELSTDKKPKDYFITELPLLNAFLESNLLDTSWTLFGLSALGFSLTKEVNKQKYLEEGPESFGYVIREDGTRSDDLTELIRNCL